MLCIQLYIHFFYSIKTTKIWEWFLKIKYNSFSDCLILNIVFSVVPERHHPHKHHRFCFFLFLGVFFSFWFYFFLYTPGPTDFERGLFKYHISGLILIHSSDVYKHKSSMLCSKIYTKNYICIIIRILCVLLFLLFFLWNVRPFFV